MNEAVIINTDLNPHRNHYESTTGGRGAEMIRDLILQALERKVLG